VQASIEVGGEDVRLARDRLEERRLGEVVRVDLPRTRLKRSVPSTILGSSFRRNAIAVVPDRGVPATKRYRTARE